MKVFLIAINPLDVFLWTVRRNERDVVHLYDTLSPIMQLATDGFMLNFGLWDDKTQDPLAAQKNLCSHISSLTELDSADLVADIGSGLCEPAEFWKQENKHLKIFCINTNFRQLRWNSNSDISKVNSTATKLPLANNSVDRIVALESAQHFTPLEYFFSEAKRVLKSSGILTFTIPITLGNQALRDLGILKFTWSSEHYTEDFIMNLVSKYNFTVSHKRLVGSGVYEALANYYIANRDKIKKSILQQYPAFVETILYKSILQMKNASQKNIIDYLVLKCKS